MIPETTTAENPPPQIDAHLQALAKLWDEDEKWWLEQGTHHAVQWCFENRVAITAAHSSPKKTSTFLSECAGCHRWYKLCMFSIRERKQNKPICRWCQAEKGFALDPQHFAIDLHIHCNQPGMRTCFERQLAAHVPEPSHEGYEEGIEDNAHSKKHLEVREEGTQQKRKVVDYGELEEDAAGIKRVDRPKVQFTVKKKMGQTERNATQKSVFGGAGF